MQISEERAKRLAELLCDAMIELEELLTRYPLGKHVRKLMADLNAEFTLSAAGTPVLKQKEEEKQDGE